MEIKMSHLKVNGANIYYEEQGSEAETIIFSHGFSQQASGLENE